MKYLSYLFLFTTTFAFSQHTNFNTQRNWSLNKKEIIFGLGATQFLGDLGGRDRIGTDYSVIDLDWPSTHIGGMVGYRYRFHPYWATTTTFNAGIIKGNDALTQELVRNSRNLHFRSLVLDLQQRLEFIILANEKFGARYRIKGHKFMRNKNDQVYLFAGIGISYFEPKARYNGKWVKLRPLRTEGQGLAGGPDEYLPITAIVPMGIGVRMGINRMWRVGLEATYNLTFTDYMDDVHGEYYDADILAQEVGAESAYLSNPAHENPTWFGTGMQRGDEQNDAYFHVNLVFYRNITYKDYGRQRRKTKWRGGRYKF